MKKDDNLSIATRIFASGILKNLITNILSFVNRTVFICYLGKELLGINSAVISIINILSLSELGIGTSFIFILYSALKRHDENEINSIMAYFKKIYSFIGVFIICIGILIIPFLNSFILTSDEMEKYVLPCYIICVFQTSITYFFSAYKRCLLMADKKEDKINNILTIWAIGNSAVQLSAILITKNFIMYLIVGAISNVIQNLIIAYVTQKEYTYLNLKNAKAVSSDVKKVLKTSVSSIMVVKIGQAFYKASDSIIVSKFLGVAILAMYDNYYMLINIIQQILSTLITSFNAIIGNLATDGNNDDLYSKYKKLEFIAVSLFMTCAVCYVNCVNPFIKWWLADDYLLDVSFVIFVASRFWVVGLNQTLMVFKDSMGLFKYGRFLSPLTGISNIILSVILLKFIGVAGVALASLVCDLCIYFVAHPKAVIKIGMKKGLQEYYKRYVLYWIMYLSSLFITKYVISHILLANSFIQFIFNGIISAILSITIITIFMRRTEEYKYLLNICISKIIKLIVKK